MKKFIAAILLCLPVIVSAQNTWEQKQEDHSMQKYLVGAVPVVNGQVTFSKTIACPGKSKSQIYDQTINYLKKMIKEEGQLEQSRIVMDDKDKNTAIAHFEEWLVFTKKAWNLDRTRLYYNLTCACSDGKMVITMNRIHYLYDEERDGFAYRAEEWITDKYGLNKKQTKLARVSGKFRQKTIDRKDYIFTQFENLLNK